MPLNHQRRRIGALALAAALWLGRSEALQAQAAERL